MLKKPQIILLDEPTSALDSFSEEEVTKAFENLFQ
jgi:ABC-type multidrug transport system fused ATPase/permease subunit